MLYNLPTNDSTRGTNLWNWNAWTNSRQPPQTSSNSYPLYFGAPLPPDPPLPQPTNDSTRGTNPWDWNTWGASHPFASPTPQPVPTPSYQPPETSNVNFDIPHPATPFKPYLMKALKGADKTAKEMGPLLKGQYSSLMRMALGPGAFQGTLNNLASRGVLDSFVARDALSRAGSNIAKNVGNMGYISQLQGMNAKMKLPGMWSNAMNFATQDQLAPYQIMSRMLMY